MGRKANLNCFSDAEDWDFYLTSPPLWKQIEVILEKYPDGGQILKVRRIFGMAQLIRKSKQELVQNADDAGATEVQFLLDSRPDAYGRDTLINREMAHFQGPALYAQNNAVFQPSDWKSIQKLYQSEKKKDPMKVGRFGIGFNSVYHLTGGKTFINEQNYIELLSRFAQCSKWQQNRIH